MDDATGRAMMNNEQMRAAFEAWAGIKYRNVDEYSNRDHAIGLSAWQAAMAHRIEPVDGLLAQAIEQCDGCMDETQVEPEDAAAWQIVRKHITPSPAQAQPVAYAAQAFENGKRHVHEQALVVTHSLMRERDEAFAKGRSAGIEEAARIVEDYQADQGIVTFTEQAIAIRSLDTKPSE